MQLGKLPEAQLDTEEAERLAVAEDSAVVVFMARYNLGYIKFLAGDLPGSLAAMSAAEELAPEAALGVPALDRARVLLAAGLVGEAGDYASGAIATFTENRAVAVPGRRPHGPGGHSRDGGRPGDRAACSPGSPPGSAAVGEIGRPRLLAQLAEQRAQASLRRDAATRPVRPGVDRRRAMADARSASALSEDLAAAGLAQDAVAASLLGRGGTPGRPGGEHRGSVLRRRRFPRRQPGRPAPGPAGGCPDRHGSRQTAPGADPAQAGTRRAGRIPGALRIPGPAGRGGGLGSGTVPRGAARGRCDGRAGCHPAVAGAVQGDHHEAAARAAARRTRGWRRTSARCGSPRTRPGRRCCPAARTRNASGRWGRSGGGSGRGRGHWAERAPRYAHRRWRRCDEL